MHGFRNPQHPLSPSTIHQKNLHTKEMRVENNSTRQEIRMLTLSICSPLNFLKNLDNLYLVKKTPKYPTIKTVLDMHNLLPQNPHESETKVSNVQQIIKCFNFNTGKIELE